MDKKYHKLWILLREILTRKEDQADAYSEACLQTHETLTLMAELEAAEFLEG